MARVAVIGAGIAGLAAARALADAGRDVRVFDKARGVGGRTSTRRHDTGAFDHGAQYFTCRSNSFRTQVEEWCARGVAARWDAKIVSLAGGALHAPRGEVTRYVGTPGMNAPAKALAEGLDVVCGVRIARVEGGAGARTLVGEDGRREGPFATVVVATPAPQAVPLLDASPRLAACASGVAMQPCLALMATFADPLGVDFDGAFVEHSPLSWVARNTAKPGRPAGECWVLHAGPAWSAQHLEDDPDAATRHLLDALAEALGRPLSAPAHAALHRWRFARSAAPTELADVFDAEAGLGLCGDWTLGDRVEGAWQSGVRLARALASV